MGLQRPDADFEHRQLLPGPSRFRREQHQTLALTAARAVLPRYSLKCVSYEDRACFEVDVIPAQRECLTLA